MVRERRRRIGVLLVALVAAGALTRAVYEAPEGSARIPVLALVLTAVFVGGSVLSGGMPRAATRRRKHPVVGPVLTGVLLFAVVAVLGEVSRLVPPVRDVVEATYERADLGFLVLALTCLAGAAEEVFYRGALFERLPFPVVTATLAHVAATLPAWNVALTAAAALLGVVCGLSRRVRGGWFAPAVTHVTWTLLVVTLLAG